MSARSENNIRPTLRWLLLAALATGGALLALGTVPNSQPWLGWLALVPLFVSIRFLSPIWALAGGSLWGVSFCVVAEFIRFSSVGQWHWDTFVLLSALAGLYAMGGAFASRRRGFDPVLLAAGWCALELALAPMGFKYGLLLSTQGSFTAVFVLGKLGGFVFAAFVVTLFIASVLAILIDARLRATGLRAVYSFGCRLSSALIGDTCPGPIRPLGQTHSRAPPQ